MENWKIVFVYTLVFCPVLYLTGCNPPLSSPEQIKRFEEAGPVISVDSNSLNGSRNRTGPYRIMPGNLLELQMPTILRNISSDISDSFQKAEPYYCRVSRTGIITLPIAGEIPVAGKTVSEVESLIIDAYYPKYVVNVPMVVCKVEKFQSESERVFTVVGLVNRPNAFPYPQDVQYNLMEAIAFAGGLSLVADPRYVKIYRQDTSGQVVSATFGIDDKSFSDSYKIIIKPGDVIYVDHTLTTRTNTFLSDVLHIGVGADMRYDR